MTSEHTMEPTLEFFGNHNYFGLQKDNLVVFEQYMLPCLTQEGKIILETPFRLAKSPGENNYFLNFMFLLILLFLSSSNSNLVCFRL